MFEFRFVGQFARAKLSTSHSDYERCCLCHLHPMQNVGILHEFRYRMLSMKIFGVAPFGLVTNFVLPPVNETIYEADHVYIMFVFSKRVFRGLVFAKIYQVITWPPSIMQKTFRVVWRIVPAASVVIARSFTPRHTCLSWRVAPMLWIGHFVCIDMNHFPL